MLLSIAIQSGAAASSVLTHSSFPYQKTLLVKPSKSAILISPNSNFSNPSTILHQKTKPISRISRKQRTFAAPETLADIPPSTVADVPILTPVPERVEVVVKQVEKPRLVLKFIWMEKNIGLGLDQVIPGHGTVPLSPYFFWPRKDAWEELKTTLESKPWISQKKMIILLNQATDIINLWQQSGGNITT